MIPAVGKLTATGSFGCIHPADHHALHAMTFARSIHGANNCALGILEASGVTWDPAPQAAWRRHFDTRPSCIKFHSVTAEEVELLQQPAVLAEALRCLRGVAISESGQWHFS